MSTSVELLGPQEAWVPPATKPLDEAVWQAWVGKGHAQDRRISVGRITAVKWASIAALLATAGLWSHLAPFQVVVRLVVTAGAVVVMFQAIQARHYAVAVVFGALALLYNPVVPALSLSGNWQRAVVVASAAPFGASLAWRNRRTEQNG
jgi:hypothetical protein